MARVPHERFGLAGPRINELRYIDLDAGSQCELNSLQFLIATRSSHADRCDDEMASGVTADAARSACSIAIGRGMP